MLILRLGETVTPDGIKAPSEYPDINRFIIGGPPNTRALQPIEIKQIKKRKSLSIIIVADLLYILQIEYKGLYQKVSWVVRDFGPS